MSIESAFRRLLPVPVILCLFFASFVSAQQPDNSKADQKDQQQKEQQEQDPLKRPLTEKQRKANEKALRQELSTELKRWLDQDVRWIITDEERSAFKHFPNDEERDHLNEQFWRRRDPPPNTIKKE